MQTSSCAALYHILIFILPLLEHALIVTNLPIRDPDTLHPWRPLYPAFGLVSSLLFCASSYGKVLHYLAGFKVMKQLGSQWEALACFSFLSFLKCLFAQKCPAFEEHSWKCWQRRQKAAWSLIFIIEKMDFLLFSLFSEPFVSSSSNSPFSS